MNDRFLRACRRRVARARARLLRHPGLELCGTLALLWTDRCVDTSS